jgi:hypothetical protein
MNSATNQTDESVLDRLRDVPKWVTISISLLMVVGAGAFVWWKWHAVPLAGHEIDVGEMPSARGNRYRGLRLNPTPQPVGDGIFPQLGNIYRINSGLFFTTLGTGENSSVRIPLYYSGNDLYPAEQVELVRARNAIVNNTALAAKLGLSSEQIKSLSNIAGGVGGGMKLSDDDRQQVWTTWRRYLASKDDASKATIQREMLDLLRRIGEASLAPTRADFAARAQQVSSILKSEQVKQALYR